MLVDNVFQNLYILIHFFYFYPIPLREVLISVTAIVVLSISPLTSVRFFASCILKLLLGAFTHRIMSSLLTDTFIDMEGPSLLIFASISCSKI